MRFFILSFEAFFNIVIYNFPIDWGDQGEYFFTITKYAFEKSIILIFKADTLSSGLQFYLKFKTSIFKNKNIFLSSFHCANSGLPRDLLSLSLG